MHSVTAPQETTGKSNHNTLSLLILLLRQCSTSSHTSPTPRRFRSPSSQFVHCHAVRHQATAAAMRFSEHAVRRGKFCTRPHKGPPVQCRRPAIHRYA
eukprot:5036444-Amphidinium_carterae.1